MSLHRMDEWPSLAGRERATGLEAPIRNLKRRSKTFLLDTRRRGREQGTASGGMARASGRLQERTEERGTAEVTTRNCGRVCSSATWNAIRRCLGSRMHRKSREEPCATQGAGEALGSQNSTSKPVKPPTSIRSHSAVPNTRLQIANGIPIQIGRRLGSRISSKRSGYG